MGNKEYRYFKDAKKKSLIKRKQPIERMNKHLGKTIHNEDVFINKHVFKSVQYH